MLNQPVLMSVTAAPEASKTFYGDTLGFSLTEDTPYALVFDAAGIVLRVQKLAPQQPFEPLPCTLLAWRVDNIDAEVDALTQRGVTFLRYPHFEQDERGIWSTPGARVCWFSDPDGNILSLTEHSS